MPQRASQSWMWSEAIAMIEEAEHRHRRFFELLATPAAHPTWEPPVDVFMANGEILIVVALPGADASQIAVHLSGNGVRIDAHVPPPALAYGTGIERMEIPYGAMQRQIRLPAGQFTLTEHRLSNGCLHLRLTEVRR